MQKRYRTLASETWSNQTNQR